MKHNLDKAKESFSPKLAFLLDRNAKASLVDQLTEKIRILVRNGKLRPGDVLPPYDRIASQLNVSMIVVRQAIQRLSEEGILISRPRVGTVVRTTSMRTWKGGILLIVPERHDNYIVSIMAGELTQSLLRSGYHVTTVTVFRDKQGNPDYSLLDSVALQPLDLGIVLFDRIGIAQHLASQKLPIVIISETDNLPKSCIDTIRYDASACVPNFAAHCLSSGIRTVESITVGSPEPKINDTLRASGIHVTRRIIKPLQNAGIREGVERAVFNYFRTRFVQNAKILPDLFFFDDDFALRGALTSMQEAGIHIPKDVKVVTWANFGTIPVYPYSLTRMEINPFVCGKTISNRILAILNGEKDLSPSISIRPDYIIGDSFPA